MSATIWFIIAVSAFSLAGVLLIAAVLIFIKFNIVSVIGDLTGRTVAKEIKHMREINYSSGDKRFKSSSVNINRGTLTEKVNEESIENKKVISKTHTSKRLDKKTGDLSSSPSIGLRKTNGLVADNIKEVQTEATEKLSTNATEVLIPDEIDATMVLSSETEILNPGTEVLCDGIPQNGTTVLDSSGQSKDAADTVKKVAFKVTKSVEETHTDEVI